MKALLFLSLLALTAAAAVEQIEAGAEVVQVADVVEVAEVADAADVAGVAEGADVEASVQELQEDSQLVEDELAVPEARFFTCPSGWTRYKNRCYRYVSSSLSWTNAESNCARLGASLASVHDVFDYTFLQSLTRSSGGNTAWIGGFYFQSWRWVDQSRFSYTNWAYLGSVSSLQCIYLNYNVGWYNGACTISRPFICMTGNDSC